ncbi:hypothetical protein [Halomonas sp. DQ26W]|nr:hypothetical protein [Halomonas sp. DQ26W]
MTPAGLALAWLRALPGRPVPVVGSLKAERPAWHALLEAARGHDVA